MTTESIAVSNNQPADLLDAKSRIARLEMRLEQADYLLGEALGASSDPEDMLKKLQVAKRTIEEALRDESGLMRVS